MEASNALMLDAFSCLGVLRNCLGFLQHRPRRFRIEVLGSDCVGEANGPAQVGLAEVGRAQVDPEKVALNQVSFGKVGTSQIYIPQVSASQVGSAQVDPC